MTTSKLKTGPGDLQWEKWSLERVRSIVEEYLPTFTTQQAFLIQAWDEIMRTGRLDDDRHCVDTIRRIYRAGSYPLRSEIQSALDDAWQRTLYRRSDAADKAVLDEAFTGGLHMDDSLTLAEIISQLGHAQNWTLNAEGIRQQGERQAAERRQRLIARIADNQSTYPVWKSEYGQVRYFPVGDLENESTEKLEALAVSVPQLREQIAGYGHAESNPQTEEGISLTAPAQKQIAVAEDELLVNPATGVEFTATELKRLSRNEYNRLMFSGGQSRGVARRNAISRILVGRKYGE